MRTSRCILYTVLGTLIGLLYVFQQTEIVKFGYKITAMERVLQAAMDRKTALEFTLSTLESPLNLDKNLLLQNNKFEMAQRIKLVKLNQGARKTGTSSAASLKDERQGVKRFAFQSLFASKQAEARTMR